ncbi:MAG: efflux RND transporter permease subunit, partial [Fretibacterium sp.]|nr:efflux RND transporter permease subunit [Fretibacterium sp.]
MDIARASVKRKTVVLFLCALTAIAGIIAYFQIGKLEDPAFTIKTAVVTVVYPGANAYEVEQEAASRVEDAIQAMGEVKHIRTRSTPGMAILYVDIKDEYTSEKLPQVWDILRQKLYDVQTNMPSGTTILINNDFGDVYGQFYALVGDGYTLKELWDYADFLKKNLVLVPGVASVQILGEQTEGIYVEFSSSRMAALGMSPEAVFNVLNAQNSLSAIGSATLGDRYVRLSPTSAILSVEDIGDLVIGGAGGGLTRLREVATIRRDYIDPQTFKMRFNGRPALGLGIATVEGGNVVDMGRAVSKRLKELEAFRPVGIELNEIYMQSDQVTKSVNDFIINLGESLAIVVGVLLIFMGLRSGLVIGMVLLLIIAGTFAIMNQAGIFLQIVSLSALIIALGSLVDNAIVVTEGMLVGVERGMDAEDAASDSVNGTVWAMLGGTFIAIMAFAPIGFSSHMTGEFCRSLFQVVGISMMLSWVAAITVTPVLGQLFLRRTKHQDSDPYDRLLFRAYKAFLEACLRRRAVTVGVVLAVFGVALWQFMGLEQSFFPDSNTVYFMADLWGPQGTTLDEQARAAAQMEEYLQAQPEVRNVSSFIGGGAVRFMLTYSPPDPNNAFSQLIVEVRDPEQTRPVLLRALAYMEESLPTIRGCFRNFARGSGMTPKVEARFYGEDPAVLRALAEQARQIMEDDPVQSFVRHDWREPVEVIRPRILKDQMQRLGLTRPAIAQALLTATTGMTVGAFRDGDKSLAIKAVLVPEERNRIEPLRSLPVWAPAANASVPLGTVFSTLDVTFEDDIIMRRDRSRVLTVASEVKLGENADAMLQRVRPKIEALPLPLGYRLEWGGENEMQEEAMSGMASAFLPSVVIMFTIMVFLFNGFRQPLIIFCTLPLILTGIAFGLQAAGMDLSFVAIVGVLSLIGMLAKNSIVLL